MVSQDIGSGFREYCVAVDAATGTNIWASPIGDAPWNPTATGSQGGGAGAGVYNQGDGPRSTPAVEGNNVIALSGNHMTLISLDWATGATNWINNLEALGATRPDWYCSSSPRLDNGLIFLNLNTATDGKTLCAFSTTNGSRVWANQNERATYSSPVVATILGTKQVIFATYTGIVGLDRNTGNFLWKYTYSWGTCDWMSMSPAVYSNIVFCAAAFGGGGAAAVRISFTNGTWSANEIWERLGDSYHMQWMTPVIRQGYIYGLFGGTYTPYLTCPLCCIELETGNMMWSQPNFGMGGTILVNSNVLALTEDGQLVLVKAEPSGYNELARLRVFQFDDAHHGKCWNSPAYSNGRIYARSTAGGVSVQVAATVIGPLAQLQVTPTNTTVAQYGQQQFTATAMDALGTPLNPQPAFTWSVSGGGALDTNGLLTACGIPGGPFVVMASAGGISNSTALTITSNGLPFLPAQTARVIHELTILIVTNTATAGPFVTQSQLTTNTSSFNYTNRDALLAAGWTFFGTNGTSPRDTEYTAGAGGIDYNQTNHPGVLRIPCDVGDLWGTGANENNTRNSLFRNLPTNWLSVQLRLAFAPAPTAYCQQVHLGLYQDDGNYLEVGSSYSGVSGGTGMSLTLETNSSPNDLATVSGSGTNFCFRLDRSPGSGAITGLVSLDGVAWTATGPVTPPFANPRLIIWTGSYQAPYVSGSSPNCDLSSLTIIASNNVSVSRALTYQLLSPPAGASIDTNGVITWRPALGQGMSSNLITTVVTDNGTPPFQVTNAFAVVVLAFSQPELTTSAAAGGVAISWPGDLSGWELQSTTNLGPGSVWQPVTNVPQFIDGRGTVPVQPLNMRQFYRLRLPP